MSEQSPVEDRVLALVYDVLETADTLDAWIANDQPVTVSDLREQSANLRAAAERSGVVVDATYQLRNRRAQLASRRDAVTYKMRRLRDTLKAIDTALADVDAELGRDT